ncbi:MAG: ribonuclease HII [Candidatus Njordarchaeales archaeon]
MKKYDLCIQLLLDKLDNSNSFLVMGIDEAGRGPVIGPLVMCGLVTNADTIIDMLKADLRDSKELTPTKREKLYMYILSLPALILIVEAWPPVIDQWISSGRNLNELEAFMASQIIEHAHARYGKIKYIFIDAPSTPKSFLNHLSKFITIPNLQIIAEEKADKNRPIVSAASIVAKHIRDKRIKEISKIVGYDIGSGYPSDPKTRKILEKMIATHPEFVRRSWKTVKNI